MLPYIDMHCDTLGLCLRGETDIFEQKDSMLDIKRMRQAGQMAQFFAVFFRNGRPDFIPEGMALPGDEEYFLMHRSLLLNSVQAHGDCIAMAGSWADIERNWQRGRMSAMLTIEDGRAVEGNMDRLGYFYSMGVRAMALTWNYPNCFGSPNSTDTRVMHTGLTPFGKEAVGVMNDIGMLIDVSHLSDGGFYDVARLSRKPFAATHSNCRALSPHPRNLTDDMIRMLSEKGGVAGLNFYGPFLSDDITETHSRVEDMCAHVLHMLKVGGEDCIALGTDFDGMDGSFEIGSPTQMWRLFDALKRKGLTARQLEKLASGNALRVLRDCT